MERNTGWYNAIQLKWSHLWLVIPAVHVTGCRVWVVICRPLFVMLLHWNDTSLEE